MRREDLEEILNRLPESEHARLHLIMSAGPNVSIELVVRLEPTFAVIRGREAGNQDEGRVFFLPYNEIVFAKIERVITAVEIEAWFCDSSRMTRTGDVATVTQAALPEQAVQDPAEIARQNLLDRIRAARSVTRK